MHWPCGARLANPPPPSPRPFLPAGYMPALRDATFTSWAPTHRLAARHTSWPRWALVNIAQRLPGVQVRGQAGLGKGVGAGAAPCRRLRPGVTAAQLARHWATSAALLPFPF